MRTQWIRQRTFRIAAAAALVVGLTGAVTASAAVTGSSGSQSGAATVHRLGTATVQSGMPEVARTTASTTPDCGYVAAIPADRFKGIPVFDPIKAAQPYTAELETTQGKITFKALTTAAPCTTYSFRFLAQHGYYQDTHCHRLTLQGIYVLQCGDPTGTGAGGPGYSFNDENLTGATYPAGTVAMANAGPNTNGSQFFICWKDTVLSPDYTPFGVVTSGMDVLQKIAAAGDDSQNGPGDGYPNSYVAFHSIEIHVDEG